jgi:hypothetical protein
MWRTSVLHASRYDKLRKTMNNSDAVMIKTCENQYCDDPYSIFILPRHGLSVVSFCYFPIPMYIESACILNTLLLDTHSLCLFASFQKAIRICKCSGSPLDFVFNFKSLQVDWLTDGASWSCAFGDDDAKNHHSWLSWWTFPRSVVKQCNHLVWSPFWRPATGVYKVWHVSRWIFFSSHSRSLNLRQASKKLHHQGTWSLCSGNLHSTLVGREIHWLRENS